MNYLLKGLSILVLVVISRAQITELINSETNFSNPKSFVEVLASYLGLLSFTGVVTIVSPVILKLGVFPLLFILKLISKPFVMIGLTGYLMVALTPLILARTGMTTPMFESRFHDSGIFSSIGRLFSTNMSVITSETMSFFNLDNDECKLEISCRLGKKMANIVPYLQYFAQQSGAENWIEQKYMANMVRSMTDPNDCQNICKSLKNQDNSLSSSTYASETSNSVNNVLEWLG